MTSPHRFKDEWLTRLVTDHPGITPDLIATWRQEERPFLAQILVDRGLLEAKELKERVRRAFRIEPFDAEGMSLEGSSSSLIPEALCRRLDLFPVRPMDRSIEVAMSNPVDHDALEQVEWATGREAVPLYCLPNQLDGLLGKALSPDTMIYDLARQFGGGEEVEVLSSGADEKQKEGPEEIKAPVVRLVNAIITDAVKRGASDIHIEHEDTATLVRFRIDGHLKNMLQIPSYLGVGPVVARIKIMSNLDVTERFHPQDGRAKLRVGNDEIGLRVSTLPTRIGEKVVIRILDERASQVPFEALGFRPPIRDTLEALIQRDQGIILVTGPTGSGKTTTLYSALNRVNAENINIITIEDPIEYRLPGVSQVQVDEKRGLTFASVLRSVLRQDPDIVMVGEIRDQETAEIACQAALTGHLVFSTLHTNDTVSTVARLVDMGVDGFKIAAGVLGITAQRLVRRLCSRCARPTTEDGMDPRILTGMSRYFEHPRTFEPVGCEACEFTGYKGRTGIVELLEITPRIRDAISQEESAESLRKLGMATEALKTLEEDIYHHLQEGHTSVDEVLPFLDFSRQEEGEGSSPFKPAEEAPLEAGTREDAAPPSPASPERDARPAGEVGSQEAEEAESKEPPHVLLVEADGGVRAPLADLLGEAGIQVTATGDSSEALQLSAQSSVDLLVVGAELPGMSGDSFIQVVRRVLGKLDLPILALVPGTQVDSIEAMLDAGAEDVINTPLVPKVTLARMRAALGRKNAWLTTEEVMKPKTPLQEADRIAAVRDTGLLGTQPEERFDRITRKAKEHFGVPVSYVALVDSERQWFKSQHGLGASETPRDIAFCAHTINEEEALIVNDSLLDPRFSENPLSHEPNNHRFYAGVPLRSPEGQAVGTMCIVDHEPRDLGPEALDELKQMAREVEAEIWKKDEA